MNAEKSPRLGYGDFLRCLATLAVVVLHCAGAALATQDPGSLTFLGLNILDGLGRWAAPMFVMLSGMFLLDPQRPMSRQKWLAHLGRIALAILIWGFFYALWGAREAHPGAEWFLEGLISMVTGRLHYHLWFLPMLLGLYLLIPPLRALVRGASRRTLWYAMGLWCAVMTLRTLFAIFPDAPGSTWLGLVNLWSTVGYPGFFLLGYLLRTCQPSRRQEWAVYALGAVGAVTTVWGTQALSQAAGAFREPLYSYLTPNTLFVAAALFLLARRLELGAAPVWSKLSGLTFGVYLLHPFFLEFFQQVLGFPGSGWDPFWAVFAQAPVALAAALAAAWALRRIPRLGKHLC